jgi:hypothetical protein
VTLDDLRVKAQAALPALPKPEVHRAAWDGSPGWSQYHDQCDPLPADWDDEPPHEVQGFFSGDQLRAVQLATWNAAIEHAAQGADEHRTTTFSGRYFDGYADAAKNIGECIRSAALRNNVQGDERGD